MSGPTGTQYEIAAHGSRAVITEIGAGLRLFEVDGEPFTQSFGPDEKPPMGSGQVLFPWPNRLAGGRWTLDGAQYELAQTEAARGNAIHGLVRRSPWELAEQEQARVLLRTTVPEAPGWPVPLSTSIEYAVDGWGLRVTHRVRNEGRRTVPFGLGVHPYPRPGNADPADCTLTLPAGTVLPLDAESMLPTGRPEPVEGTRWDLRAGRPLGELALDNAFGGLEAGADGIVRHTVRSAGGPGVELWADGEFRWVQCYTPGDYPGAGGPAVAIEPMTCPPDALNSGTDLIQLSPGQEWTGRWGIRPLR